MAELWQLNLIHFFEFYLALAFALSTGVRIRQYQAIIRLIRVVPDRWPRLLRLVKEHHAIFLTWSTALPTLLALVLCVLNTLACRLVWPQANLTTGMVRGLWVAIPILLLSGVAMFVVDGYATFAVGTIDRPQIEKYFDQAEFWLRSWVAPVVRAFTFGYVNPRKMVAVEVQKALMQASQLLNSSMWWMTVQVSLRIVFGLSLWLTWAWSSKQPLGP
jgi:hypothetical protein